MKNKVYIFHPHGVRILTNPDNLEDLAKFPNVLVNADVSHLAGIDLHKWRKVGNKIEIDHNAPMPPSGASHQVKVLVKEIHTPVIQTVIKREMSTWPLLGMFVLGFILGYFL